MNISLYVNYRENKHKTENKMASLFSKNKYLRGFFLKPWGEHSSGIPWSFPSYLFVRKIYSFVIFFFQTEFGGLGSFKWT